jgi:hypothetical protein
VLQWMMTKYLLGALIHLRGAMNPSSRSHVVWNR